MRYAIGIDPGLSGAIAIFDIKLNKPAEVWDMPTLEVAVGKSLKRRVAPELIVSELRPWAAEVSMAFVESVSASPQMGVSSSFAFGESYGLVRGVLAGLGIPFTPVVPAKWKRDLGLSRDKDASRAMAIRLFPDMAQEFKRVKDDGRAESVLIAMWGVKQ